MTIIARKTENVAVDVIRQHPQNPRKGDVETIVESIKVNGFYHPLIAQHSTGFVLSGNHRLQAAQKLGFTEVPVTWVDVDDDTALNILLVDNRSSDKGGYDNAKLAELLQTRSEVDDELTGTGYDNAALVSLLKQLEDSEPGPTPERPKSSTSPAVRTSEPDEPRDSPDTGGGYIPQPGVLVICEDEGEQNDVAERLEADGYNVRKIST